MLRLHADIYIARFYAMPLGARYGDKERENSQDQDHQTHTE